jgi:uncharacterized protein (DUF305 family)
MSRRDSLWLTVFPVALLATACAKDTGERRDTAAASAAVGGANANPMDTGMTSGTHDMAGMNHGAMASRSAAKDSNQSFLRMMSDHHQGLVAMSDTAMGKLGATARSDAEKLRTDQKKEQDHMLQMLRSDYKDSVTPMLLPSNQAVISTVAQAGQGEVDRAYYQQVIAHHREGVQMIDKMLPQLTGMTKEMATTSRTKQQKEIAEFEKKAGTTG